MRPRIYTYKITFLETPHYYYGVHKEKVFNEEYLGSSVTHRWIWDFYTPNKQILETFDFTDDGYVEAQEVEKRIIKQFINDKWCLNENCGGIFSLNSCSKAGKMGSLVTMKKGVGLFGMDKETHIKGAKKGTQTQKKNKIGLFGASKEQLIEWGKRGALGQSKQELSEAGRKGAQKSNSQKWKCLITGYISNPGGLTKYQRAKGIDCLNRIRVS